MSSYSVLAQDRESLEGMGQALRSMMDRLQSIIINDAITEDDLIEITSIYNNVAYIFLYLEANDEYVRYDSLLPLRDAFHQNDALDRKIFELISQLQCTDPEAEEARLAYVEQLEQKLAGDDDTFLNEMTGRIALAKGVLGDIDEAHAAIVRRLGITNVEATPAAIFYRLISDTGSEATRSKLIRVWRASRDEHMPRLVAVINEMVEARRRHSKSQGYESPLAESLAKCSVSEMQVRKFLDSYLKSAIQATIDLESDVRRLTGAEELPLEHFGHYLKSIGGGVPAPLFVLDDCLQFIFTVMQNVFGLTIERVGNDGAVIYVRVSSAGQECGEIDLDLWATDAKSSSPNSTRGLRNRTDWSRVVQKPVAYVSCRFSRLEDGVQRITFQNVHSLFHEFGHAVNHLLIRKRISNRSGLEYLPLERVEMLSMWSEKWVYHPDFASFVTHQDVNVESVALCQRIKLLEYRRTYVERAVTALLDFEVHRRDVGGLDSVFDELNDSYALSRFCEIGDFPGYFTWPMFTANPGANFSYLIGSADSCEKFLPFSALSIDALSRQRPSKDLFASLFDFSLPTVMPNPQSVFDFYNAPVAATAQEGLS